jgi:hypothetical protein
MGGTVSEATGAGNGGTAAITSWLNGLLALLKKQC